MEGHKNSNERNSNYPKTHVTTGRKAAGVEPTEECLTSLAGFEAKYERPAGKAFPSVCGMAVSLRTKAVRRPNLPVQVRCNRSVPDPAGTPAPCAPPGIRAMHKARVDLVQVAVRQAAIAVIEPIAGQGSV